MHIPAIENKPPRVNHTAMVINIQTDKRLHFPTLYFQYKKNVINVQKASEEYGFASFA